MEEFKLEIRELIANEFMEVIRTNNAVNMGEFYAAVMSATLTVLGNIAEFTGENPRDVVTEILTQSLNQI